MTSLSRRGLLNTVAAAGFVAAARAQSIPDTTTPGSKDWRDIRNGSEIPREGYSDQPYVVITKDGNWLCVLTTGVGVEGQTGQHIIATISKDKGKTWSKPVDIEPAKGPEASWVMPLMTPSGRVYVFYTYNADNLRFDTKSNSPNMAKRVDTLGKYAFKYSDDGGLTWSNNRYYIPVRLFRIDRENAYGGKVVYFWGVGKPITTRHGAIFGFAKVGKWGDPGGMVTSQACFMHSRNILSEKNPEKIDWETLPEGDEGLRAPKGAVADEANLVELNDGSLYATYRTIDGYNCAAYSRDSGKTWTPSAYAVYKPGGRRIKHPRAANFVKKFSNGKYLLWFHNHGGEPVHASNWSSYHVDRKPGEPPRATYYDNRNPGWILAGVEKSGYIHWAEPEILLYDPEPATKISYPDFVEDNGEFYITETMKTHARVHHIDRSLLEGAWNQLENRTLTRNGLLLEVNGQSTPPGAAVKMPTLPSLLTGGITVDFWLKLSELSPGQVLFDATTEGGKGIRIFVSDRFTIGISLNDGQRQSVWDCDPGTHEGTLRSGIWQYFAFTVDGGPKIISVMVDGFLNDGGAVREYGWTRFDKNLDDVNGPGEAKFAPAIFGNLKTLRIYGRYLRTSEMAGNWRAGL